MARAPWFPFAILATAAGLFACATPADARDSEPSAIAAFQTIEYRSEDGLAITADVYETADATSPVIVLFHQAGFSRGEYREIAPKLVALGFSCMAVDQRSGDAVGGVRNETHARAQKARKKTTYIDAIPDLRASMSEARRRFPKARRTIAWGSSYSAALVLVLAGEDRNFADAVLSFAPGEYFGKLGKPKGFVTQAASKIRVPVFITSAKSEQKGWAGIFAGIEAPGKHSFVPKTEGNHGSRALWNKFADSEAYWQAVREFLHGLETAR